MYKHYYAQRDTTLYEFYPTRNTGRDSIIELTKVPSGSTIDGNFYSKNYNSRILLQFDLASISASVVDGTIPVGSKYYLSLRNATAESLPYTYTIYAYPVSESWDTGYGTYNSDPSITTDASWTYRVNQGSVQTAWRTGSYAVNSTGSINGGGTWFTSSVASQSFSYQDTDVRMDITNIVNAWLNGNIVNNGLIIKRLDSDENSSEILGSLKFYATDSNTIYVPKIQVAINDYTVNATYPELSDDNPIIYFKNLQNTYNEKSIVKLRIGGRPAYPARTYSTSSNYLVNYRLPSTSYYAIKDTVTEETIIDYDTVYTQISSDSNGSYIKLDLNAFLPERFYRILIKTIDSTLGQTFIHDNGFWFKVVR
jgi:hypothetical protein